MSDDRVKNTPRCQAATRQSITSRFDQVSSPDKSLTDYHGTTLQSPVNHTEQLPGRESRLSYHSITSPFPSPHEFGYAEQVHGSSIPASPTSPSAANRNVRRSLQAHSPSSSLDIWEDDVLDSCDLTPTTPKSPNLPLKPSIHAVVTETISLSCPIVARHPLHTYILPRLCPVCFAQREYNLARFEAETIKEAIDRENWGYRKGMSHGVIDGQRKRISRRSAAKGQLIPLICVEEGKFNKQAVEEEEKNEAMAAEQQAQHVEIMSIRENNSTIGDGDSNEGEFSNMVHSLLEQNSNQSQDVGATDSTQKFQRDTETKKGPLQRYCIADDSPASARSSAVTASSATSSWNLSWWGRGSISTPASPALLPKAIPSVASAGKPSTRT